MMVDVQDPPQPPADCGKRLLPALVDEIAQQRPERLFVDVPKSSRIQDGFDSITFLSFATAVNRCAWWMEEHVGHSTKPNPLLYIGPLDIRHLIILFAAAKTRNTAFFSSHRNSLEAHVSLCESAGCRTMLLPSGAPAITKQIIAERRLRVIEFPELDFFMTDSGPVPPYPFLGTWESKKDETFVILHTSGSTGIPKPVFVTHGTFAGNDAHQLVPHLGGKKTLIDLLRGKRYFVGLPLFHAACLAFTVGYNIYADVKIVLPPPVALSADLVDDMHKYGDLDGELLPPSVVVDIYNDKKAYANMLKHLNFLTYVGATLPQEVGDQIAKKLQVVTVMGSTETMLQPLQLIDDPKDWQYISVSPLLGHEFRQGGEGLHELVIVRQKKHELFQGVFSTFPDRTEFPSSDLYEAHPTEPDTWVFRARSDDIISFTNAEKLNPITMESVIKGHPSIKSAVIGGQGKFQASLLVEPKHPLVTSDEKAQFLDEIWPTIQEANRTCPAHGRIMRNFVAFTEPDRPLPRASKDSVQRQAALKMYATELDALYKPRTARSSTSTSNSTSSTVRDGSVPAMMGKAVDGHTESLMSAVPPQLMLNEIPVAKMDMPAADILLNEMKVQIREAVKESLADMLNERIALALETIAQDLRASSGRSSLHTIGAKASQPLVPTRHDLRRIVRSVFEAQGYLQQFDDDSDLFNCGLDSLQVPVIVDEINEKTKHLNMPTNLLTNRTIYGERSIAGIAAMI